MPESFFRFQYPEGKIEGNSLVMVSDKNERSVRRRVGLYDKNILCLDCDHYLGKFYDEYGKKILIDTDPKLTQIFPKANILTFDNVDTKKLKLFILSVLWRFSISTRPEVSSLKLKEGYENKLADMILNDNDGDFNDFSVVITKFKFKYADFSKYFQLPTEEYKEGLKYIKIYTPNAYKFFIKIDDQPQLKSLIPLTLNNSSDIRILQYEVFEQSDEFKALVDNAHKIN